VNDHGGGGGGISDNDGFAGGGFPGGSDFGGHHGAHAGGHSHEAGLGGPDAPGFPSRTDFSGGPKPWEFGPRGRIYRRRYRRPVPVGSPVWWVRLVARLAVLAFVAFVLYILIHGFATFNSMQTP
jgi:hypothetical protein